MGKIMYMDDEFQGRIVKGGGEPVPVDREKIGTLWNFTAESRMGFLGEMPVTLSAKKNFDTENDPYEEWLKWKKEQGLKEKEEMLKEEK